MVENVIFIFPAVAAITTMLALQAAVFQGDERRYALFKMITSLLFVLTAVKTNSREAYGWYIFGGLVLHLIGDALILQPLGQKESLRFRTGLLSFLAGHVFYFTAFSELVSPLAINPAITALILLFNGGIFLLHRRTIGRLLLPGLAYGSVLSLMVSLALTVFFLHVAPPRRALLIAVGAILYNVSDISVVRERFGGGDVRNKLWGLPLYVGGQFCMAFSMLPG